MKAFKTKGQGAMEYLMTYSWAILVIVTVGLVLWQLGVFNTGTEKATITGLTTLKPVGTSMVYSSSTSTFSVSLMNLVGTPINIEQIGILEEYQPLQCSDYMINDVAFVAPTTVTKGDAFKISANCGPKTTDDRYSATININYTVFLDNVETARTENGNIEGPVE